MQLHVPIGIPAAYAERAGISSFRDFLPKLGRGEWHEFYSVCDRAEEISVHRPFYPNGGYKGRRKEDLIRGHGVAYADALLRQCERAGEGRRQACCLFWTLGGNQVGKAAISGWRDVLSPAMQSAGLVSLWPFDGDLFSLFRPGNIVIAETYPAECCGWFSANGIRSKRDQGERKRFGSSLTQWADTAGVALESGLRREIQDGFLRGRDDAFDAVVGLFGMLQVCLGQHPTGEPEEDVVREIEGWILGCDN